MQAHDAIFKQFLSDMSIARDFLSIHLPQDVKQCCDFSTLQLTSSSFVDEALRSRLSDMLYAVRTTQGRGYIYCLIEHQSRPDKRMAFRLLRYSLAAMQQHLAQGNEDLPLVVPLLFYHGQRSPYPYSLNWLDGFNDDALARRLYTSAFPLIDLTVIPDDTLKNHRRVALLELVQKHIRTRDMLALAQDIRSLLHRWRLPPAQHRALMQYISLCGKTDRLGALIHAIAIPEIAPQEENMETIATQLKRIGFEEGVHQGMADGMKASEQRIARQLMLTGMPLRQIQQITGLADHHMQELLMASHPSKTSPS